MKEIDILVKKAFKYKENGLTEHEIAEELNVSKETVKWLLSRCKEKKPEGDVKIGWRSIGVAPLRLESISEALADVILEECDEVDTIVGVSINGVPYATLIANILGMELAIFRPHYEKSGVFSSNYASVKEKNVVIVDDVVGTGETFKSAIKATKAEKGKAVLCLALVNKKVQNKIGDVPLRALIRTRAI